MIVLTMKDEKRLVVVEKVIDGTMDMMEGTKALCFSERQMYRLMEQVRERGPSGVIKRISTRANTTWVCEIKSCVYLDPA